MHSARVGLLIIFLLLLISPIGSQSGQQTQTTAVSQGAALLMQALSALAGNTVVSDVTLNGMATRIVGSDEENGNVVMKALSSGQSLFTFTSASGQRSELISISASGLPVGSWTGTDGVAHAMSYHNLLTDSSWFFPGLTVTKVLASQAVSVALVAQEVKDGTPVIHVILAQTPTQLGANLPPQVQNLGQMDLFLDSTTLLPVALDFNTHPDNNMLQNIPVEIRFLDYRSVNGVQVPFHVQKYFNNSLFLDIQLQTASANSGLTASVFTIQ